MKKIIERKKLALENLYKKISDLEIKNKEFNKVDNTNILDKKIEVLKNNTSLDFNKEIDKIIYKYIIESHNSNISSLIELAYLYNKEKERDKLKDILNKIIDEYLKNNISKVDLDKVVQMFNKISINESILFKTINKIINNGIIQEFQDYIVNNREFLYIFDRCKNSIEIIKRIIDVLIVNQEVGLQLGYKELFKIMNNHLKSIQLEELDIEIYTDILLLELVYGEECNSINVNDLSIIDYEYSKEKELIDLIITGINDLYFDEYRIFKTCNYRQRYLINKIIESTMNLDIIFKYSNKKHNYNSRAENSNNKLKEDYNTIEKVYEIDNKDKFCKVCLEKYSKSKVWLAYYTDLNQEKYNGVILATLFKCNKCNKYYSTRKYIESLERELDGDIIKFINYND